MLKIVGIPTEDEAIKLYNDWKQERDNWNKEAKKHNNILVLVVVAIYLVVTAGALTWSFFIPTDIPMNLFRVSFALVSAGACFCVVAINWCW